MLLLCDAFKCLLIRDTFQENVWFYKPATITHVAVGVADQNKRYSYRRENQKIRYFSSGMQVLLYSLWKGQAWMYYMRVLRCRKLG